MKLNKPLKLLPLELLSLLSINFIIFLIVFRWIIPFRGTLIYGDLPGFYLFPPINVTWLAGLTMYPLIEQLASFVTGPVMAQDAFLMGTFFLPSIGIFFFLKEFDNDPFVIIPVSVVFGTILDPVMFGMFLGGGFEYGPWIFFVFFSMKYIYRAKNTEGHATRYIIYSAILYSLSLSSTNFFPGGIYISLPFVLPMLFYRANVQHIWKTLIKPSSIFLLVTAIMLFSLLLSDLKYDLGYLSSPASLTSAQAYLYGNMRFEFSIYSLPSAILGASWGGPEFGFFTAFPYYTISCMVILGGVFSFLFKEKNKGILIHFFVIYVVAGLIIFSLTFASADRFFLSLNLFDSLEYPVFYLYAMLIAAPLLLVNFVSRFSVMIEHGYLSHLSQFFSSRYHRKKHFDRLRENFRQYKAIRLLVVALVIILMVMNDNGFLSNSSTDFMKAQGEPYIPAGDYALHNWYEKNSNNITGNILVLPSYNNFFIELSMALIPSGKLLDKSVGPPIAGFNATSYFAVLSLVSENKTAEYANYLAIMDVQYVILFNYTGKSQLTPSSSSTFLVLDNYLLHSSRFLSVDITKAYAIFINILYSNLTVNAYSLTPTKEGNNYDAQTNILNQSNFGAYLESEVSHQNGIFVLKGPYNRTTPLTEIFFPLYSNNGFLNESISNISTDTLYPGTFVRYELRWELEKITNSTLHLSVFYFNTSVPASFYGYFSTQNIPTQYNPNSNAVNLSIPTGTRFIYLIFEIAENGTKSFLAKIGNISLTQMIEAENVSDSFSFQQLIMSGLTSADLIPSGSLFLSPPFKSLVTAKVHLENIVADSAMPFYTNGANLDIPLVAFCFHSSVDNASTFIEVYAPQGYSNGVVTSLTNGTVIPISQSVYLYNLASQCETDLDLHIPKGSEAIFIGVVYG